MTQFKIISQYTRGTRFVTGFLQSLVFQRFLIFQRSSKDLSKNLSKIWGVFTPPPIEGSYWFHFLSAIDTDNITNSQQNRCQYTAFSNVSRIHLARFNDLLSPKFSQKWIPGFDGEFREHCKWPVYHCEFLNWIWNLVVEYIRWWGLPDSSWSVRTGIFLFRCLHMTFPYAICLGVFFSKVVTLLQLLGTSQMFPPNANSFWIYGWEFASFASLPLSSFILFSFPTPSPTSSLFSLSFFFPVPVLLLLLKSEWLF